MWFSRQVLDDLVYWKTPRESGIVFGSILVILLAIKYISVISVIGNLCLALVTSTLSFRVYKSVLSTVNKTQDGHPFQRFLEMDVTLPADKVKNVTESFVDKFNIMILYLKKIFLIEDSWESAKFALIMYAMTYVGALINIGTLFLLAWIILFSAPRIYRDNQKQIDEGLAPLKMKFGELISKMKAIKNNKKEE